MQADQSFGSARSLNLRRGFTLIEMMVVVLIITLLATIAVPSASRQMRNHRAKQAIERVSTVYRTARLRAMGRSAAVLVRYNAGQFTTWEAIRGGPTIGCEQLPESSCIVTDPGDRWSSPAMSTRRQLLETYPVNTATFTTAASVTVGATPTPTTYLEVCYTPAGRALYRTAASNTFTAMRAPALINLSRVDGLGLSRQAIIRSSGNSRVTSNAFP